MGASYGKEIQMTSKPISRKIISIVTAALTMVVMCGLPAFAYAADTGVSKEETVYVVTNSTGEQQDVIVSDHLVNKGKVKTISDETTLSDIENVKGEETFKQNGDALTWDAGGNSIYYQGKTTEEVPVTMDVTYRLDDKVVSGPELQGKSGKVEIRIHYENTATYEGSTVPFIVMTGLMVTDETFKNIKVSKGKVIDDGEKLMVVGMAAPGLAQTLGIGESELGIGSTVIITGDAEEFAVEDMMTIVTNAFFEDIDSDSIDDLDYDDEIKQLDKGANALADGSDQLYKGLDALSDKMPDLKQGVKSLKDGSDALEKGTNDAKKGAETLSAGMEELTGSLPSKLETISTNLGTIKAGSQAVTNGLGELKDNLDGAGAGATAIQTGLTTVSGQLTGAASTAAGLDSNADTSSEACREISAKIAELKTNNTIDDDQYYAIMNAIGSDLTEIQTQNGTISATASGLESGLKSAATALTGEESQIYNGVGQLGAGLDAAYDAVAGEDKLLAGSTAVTGGIETLQTGVNDSITAMQPKLTLLNTGAKQLKDGEVNLAGGAKQLAEGMDKLYNSADTMVNGVYQLDNGAYKLRQGMSKLYKQGIKKIVDMYNDELKGTLNDARSMLDAGKGYKTFTKLPSSMDGNVKFIYKTDMTE